MDVSTLERDAAALQREGIATSSVGNGDGYSGDQLRALSDGGGGTFHDDELPKEIAQVIMFELNGRRAMAAEDVVVSVTAPDGVRLEQVSRYPGSVGRKPGGGAARRRRFGSDASGCAAGLLPAGTEGDSIPFEVSVARCPR